MVSKVKHLEMIIESRAGWTAADKAMANRLATVRADIDKLSNQIEREGYAVSTQSGGSKTNPKVGARDRLVKEEAQLTKRLALGDKRTAGGRSESVEKRNRQALAMIGHLNDPDEWTGLMDLIPGYAVSCAAVGVSAEDLTIPECRERFERDTAGKELDIERIREANKL